MLSKYALIILLVTLSIFPHKANSISTLNKGLVGTVLYFGATTAIKKGGPFVIRLTAKKVKNYILKNPDKAKFFVREIIAFAVENYELTSKSLDLMAKAGITEILPSYGYSEKQIIEESKDFAKAYVAVTASVNDINEDSYCKDNQILRELTQSNFDNLMLSASNPVQYKDTGSYRALYSRMMVGDDLEHDHIPSSKAVLKYVTSKLGDGFSSTKSSRSKIHQNSSTIEVPSKLHRLGRTHGGKNSTIKIALDAKDLKKASFKDMAYHLMNTNFDMSLLIPFKKLYIRNATLCLYQ